MQSLKEVQGNAADGDEQRKARDFRDGRNEGCCGGGGAFVSIRRPEMEGDSRDFEAKSGGDHDESEIEQRRSAMGRCHVGAIDYARQTCGARKSVEIAEAEEQEGRGHATEEVVLDRKSTRLNSSHL